MTDAVKIDLTQGKVAIIDRADLPAVSKHVWRAKINRHVWYAYTTVPGTKNKTISLHRFIRPPGKD